MSTVRKLVFQKHQFLHWPQSDSGSSR